MTNAETISKLNNALSTLIKAYEELQDENNNLKNRITELEDEVLDLEAAKEDLEKNVDEFKNNTQEDRSNISTMLGKIESILNRQTGDLTPKPSVVKEEIKVNEVKDEEVETKEEPNILNTASSNSFENVLKKEEDSSNKIDLNRMASLLNGFNH